MKQRLLLSVALAASMLLSGVASATIILDDNLSDVTMNIVQFDGGPITWATGGANFSPNGWWGTNEYSDLVGGNENLYQNDGYKLPESVTDLVFTLKNIGGTASKAATTGSLVLTWFDSTVFSGTGTNTGRTASSVSSVALPVIPAGGTATVSVPVNLFTTGVKTFGDMGDAFGALKWNNVFAGARPNTSYAWSNLLISDVRFVVPEPATLVLLTLGGLAMLRRRS
jgi:hypothetical protein